MSTRIALTTIVALTVLLTAAPPVGAQVERKPFGFTSFTMQTLESQSVVGLVGGKLEVHDVPSTVTQAGGHPWALATTIEFTGEEFLNTLGQTNVAPTQDPRDVVVDLPPGLLGNPNPQAFPRCPLSLLLSHHVCPADTQLGVVRFRWFGGSSESLGPIVNVTPERGQSAEFGLETTFNTTTLLTAHVVRVENPVTKQAEYRLAVVSNEIPDVELLEAETTFWGVPGDPSHDPMRGLRCNGSSLQSECKGGNVSSGILPVPFLSMPTDCSGGPLITNARADSWQEPGVYREAQATQPAVTGCDLLRFNPQIEVLPDTLVADGPVSLGVNVKVPQLESAAAPASPQLRDSVVTLPEGLSISPGIVDGIQACDREGPEGINFEGPESEEIGFNGEPQLAPGHCPNASTVGTAEAITPLLPEPVKGHLYLARPECGGAGESPCTEEDALHGRIYKLYLELGGVGPLADTGVNLKVEGKVEANPATGQLTTVFKDTPQLPFSELKLHLNGGPRAPLDTPAACGRATTSTDFTPWSAPGITPEGLSVPGTADATPSSFFEVAGCANPPGFSPGFTAGTVSPQAGAFSAFTLNFTRQDREQYLSGIQVHTPPGLLGMLSSVPLCGEPQAAQGTCPESSRIGTTRVASGAGSHPFEISGNVYLTTGYKGAPFGLSIATDAVAGPFNLGLVVVRARIDVDPVTSQLTVTSDPLPQIVFGVPLRLKRVTVNIDRPGFMFNPTNCSAQHLTAVVSGAQNAVASVQSPFAVGGCRSLAFKPQFTVSTSGHTSKANGASLDAKVSYPAGSMGSEANIASVKVELPKQLPSRLTTLQKACTAAQFESNPAGCPAASVIGVVRASTPVLPVGLTGPVYFVSHGGEAFPSLVIVLQGDGVRVDLTAATFISKAGITSSTFKTVPDVPVNTFELYLPEGKFSALAANGSLCASAGKLKMPTEMVAQNGAVIRQSTKVAVTGCPKAKKAEARKKKPKAKRAKKAGHGRSGK